MKKMILTGLILSSLAVAQTAWPANVTPVTVIANQTVSVDGKFEAGAAIADLSWAANSSMACFPATQNANFRGNHVFYAASLPPKSILTVTLAPKNPKQLTSIYGYSVGSNNFAVPPKIQSAVTCEAEHTWDRPKVGKTQDHTRPIMFQNPTGNTYNIFIGVSGPAAVTAGDYTLSFALKQ